MKVIKLHDRVISLVFETDRSELHQGSETIEVDSCGMIQLDGTYSPSDLKKIASAVNKEMLHKFTESICQNIKEEEQ